MKTSDAAIIRTIADITMVPDAVAEGVINALGGWRELFGADSDRLVFAGFDVGQAERLLSAVSFARAYRTMHGRRDHAGAAGDVWELAAGEGWDAGNVETFRVISLDVHNGIMGHDVVGVGHVSGVEVHPREVFRAAMLRAAAGIVLVHNHPGGDPTPSEKDIAITRRAVMAGQIIGVPVVDHVVVASRGFCSIREQNAGAWASWALLEAARAS